MVARAKSLMQRKEGKRFTCMPRVEERDIIQRGAIGKASEGDFDKSREGLIETSIGQVLLAEKPVFANFPIVSAVARDKRTNM